jgi:hypothetical protein
METLQALRPVSLENCPMCGVRLMHLSAFNGKHTGYTLGCQGCGYRREVSDLCVCFELAGDNPNCPEHGGLHG